MYDYLVVGFGLLGAVFAHGVKAHGKTVLVVGKRSSIGGNIYRLLRRSMFISSLNWVRTRTAMNLQKQLSAENTVLSGNQATSRIIRSMMKRMENCMRSIRN